MAKRGIDHQSGEKRRPSFLYLRSYSPCLQCFIDDVKNVLERPRTVCIESKVLQYEGWIALN